jgi:wyosine [tRNA(Phe)-imidazoG37] synthetase (radical SAM superfamily)
MTLETSLLSTSDHDRDAVGMTYVYPVLSRRAGGVSLGINLNVNNACNWRCVYCQVPNLARGGPPPMDLDQLAEELERLLADIVLGDYLRRHVPEGLRRLNDIALSGNGEPTNARELPEVIDLAGAMLDRHGLLGQVKIILITNGSQARKAHVSEGLRRLAELGGEVWFKLDRGTAEGMRVTNGAAITPELALARLERCASLCPTRIQTCAFALDGEPPAETELVAYLDLLRAASRLPRPPRDVLLYGLARPSLQPGAERLGRLSEEWMSRFAARIEETGLACACFP